VRDANELTVSGSRWLLAGDAAGLVDPITREGIYFALASGQWAAESLLRDGFASDLCVARREEAGTRAWPRGSLQGRFLPSRLSSTSSCARCSRARACAR
jgi:hypothetical protein